MKPNTPLPGSKRPLDPNSPVDRAILHERRQAQQEQFLKRMQAGVVQQLQQEAQKNFRPGGKLYFGIVNDLALIYSAPAPFSLFAFADFGALANDLRRWAEQLDTYVKEREKPSETPAEQNPPPAAPAAPTAPEPSGESTLDLSAVKEH